MELKVNAQFEQVRYTAAQLCHENKQEEAREVWKTFLNSVVFKEPWGIIVTYSEICIEQLPDYHIGFLTNGIANQHTGDYVLALKRFSKVLALYPGHSLALKHKCETLNAMELYLEALECAEELRMTDPGKPEYLRLCSSNLMMLHRYEEACIQIDEALSCNPCDTHLLIDRAICLGFAGKLKGAMKQYARVEKLIKNTVMSSERISTLAFVHLNRGEARKQLKDHTRGEDELALGFALLELSNSGAFERRSN